MDNVDFWKFIEANKAQSPAALRLKYHGKTLGFDVEFAILQIECRQHFGKKLAATLSAVPQFIFPTLLAGEQATSDRLADFHASLVPAGKTIADLTCGLGIDAMHLAKQASSLTAIDNEVAKIEALQHNLRCAGISNMSCDCTDCEQFINRCTEKYDYAFIDPARRRDDGSRTYGLQECSPDIIALQSSVSRMAGRLMAKCSPMLDISLTASQLSHVESIYVIGTSTECKELLVVCDYTKPTGEYSITAVSLSAAGTDEFQFTPSQERECPDALIGIPHPGQFLYVPSPAIMKAAPFKLLAKKFGLTKLHANTHLYFSDSDAIAFPGQKLKIADVISYESKNIKRLKRTYPTISVASRNFDITADDLRRKLGVKDGGEYRLFGVTAGNGSKQMIVAGA